MSRVLLVVAGLAVVAGGVAVWGQLRWSGLTDTRVARLQSARTPIDAGRVDLAGLDTLPAPVRRYLKRVLQDGVPRTAALRIEHRGEIDTAERGGSWKPFTSRQWVVTQRPGFVWDGRVSIAPGLAVHVHDAYMAGEGVLQASLLGALDVADQHGAGDIAAGELMRFLAESAWYPTVLLPGQGVTWTEVDDRSALATLADGPNRVSLTVRFTDDDLIAGVHAAERGRTVGGRVVPTPWEGRFDDYRTWGGVLVPTRGEVAWLLPEGRRPYWRATITAIDVEPAR